MITKWNEKEKKKNKRQSIFFLISSIQRKYIAMREGDKLPKKKRDIIQSVYNKSRSIYI